MKGDASEQTGDLVALHSDFDGLIPSQLRIGTFSGGTRISMLLGISANEAVTFERDDHLMSWPRQRSARKSGTMQTFFIKGFQR